MSIFRKGSKQAHEQEAKEKAEMEKKADSIVRQTLETVESGLRVKREVREKAARFIEAHRSVGYKHST